MHPLIDTSLESSLLVSKRKFIISKTRSPYNSFLQVHCLLTDRYLNELWKLRHFGSQKYQKKHKPGASLLIKASRKSKISPSCRSSRIHESDDLKKQNSVDTTDTAQDIKIDSQSTLANDISEAQLKKTDSDSNPTQKDIVSLNVVQTKMEVENQPEPIVPKKEPQVLVVPATPKLILFDYAKKRSPMLRWVKKNCYQMELSHHSLSLVSRYLDMYFEDFGIQYLPDLIKINALMAAMIDLAIRTEETKKARISIVSKYVNMDPEYVKEVQVEVIKKIKFRTRHWTYSYKLDELMGIWDAKYPHMSFFCEKEESYKRYRLVYHSIENMLIYQGMNSSNQDEYIPRAILAVVGDSWQHRMLLGYSLQAAPVALANNVQLSEVRRPNWVRCYFDYLFLQANIQETAKKGASTQA